MYFYFAICLILTSVPTGLANSEYRSAIAIFRYQNVTGTVLFTETDEGLRVIGNVTGLDEGKYGFHVHELGDTTTCDTAGGHFNPVSSPHGGRDRVHTERHAGDLGNLQFVGVGNGESSFDYIDKVITLRGHNNILGRSLVVHEGQDDLGLGDNPDSLVTGNSGPRVSCAPIVMTAPVEAWEYNSSFYVGPSIPLVSLLFIISLVSNFN